MAIIDELITLLGVKVSPDAARNIAGFKSKMTSLGRNVTVALAGFTAARVAVQAFAQAAAVQASELQRLSDQTGVSTDKLQEWGYAASAVGANAKAVQGDIASLGKRFGMMGEPDKLLEGLAGKFGGMSARQAQMMGSMYGISPDTIMLLRKGADGVRKLRQEARDTGAIIDPELIERGAEFNRTIQKVTYTVKALGMQIALGALPAVEKLVSAFHEFIVRNREFLREKTQAVIEGVTKGFDRFLDRLGKLWQALEPVRKVFAKLTEGMEGADVVAHLVEGALLTLGIAAGIAALPFLKTIAVFTALAIIAEDLFESITTGEGVFAGLWKSLTAGEGPLSGIIGPLAELWNVLAQSVMPVFADAWSVLKDIGRAFGEVGGAVMSFVNDSLGPLIQGVADTMDWLLPWFDLLRQIMKILVKFTLGSLVSSFKAVMGVLGPVVEYLGKFLSLISKGGKWLTDKLGISDTADGLRGFADSGAAYDLGRSVTGSLLPGEQRMPLNVRGGGSLTDNSQRTYNIVSPEAERVPGLIERRDASARINAPGQFAGAPAW